MRPAKKAARKRVQGLCGHWCYQWPRVRDRILCDECQDWVEQLPSDVLPGQLTLFDIVEAE